MKDGLYYAAQFRDKKLSVAEWIDERAQQVKKLNPELNAFIDWDAESAKKQYEARGAETGPFFGLPIPLKMLGQDKAGMKSTSGSRLFTENRANSTDNFVKGLERLGLIPLGKTNAPEFGFKNISDPTIYDQREIRGILIIHRAVLVVALRQLLRVAYFQLLEQVMAAVRFEFLLLLVD